LFPPEPLQRLMVVYFQNKMSSACVPFFRPYPSGKKGQDRAQFTYRNKYKVSFSQSIRVRTIFHIIVTACFQRHENGKDKLDAFSYSIFHAKFPVSIFFKIRL